MKRLVRRPFCFAVETNAYDAAKVVDGYVRPYGGPHTWVFEPMVAGESQWIEVALRETANVSEIHLTFNDDVNEDLINLHHHETPFPVIPEVVKAYDVQVRADGEWRTLLSEENNRKRNRVHRLEGPARADRVRVVVRETNGGERAELTEIRIYSQQ